MQLQGILRLRYPRHARERVMPRVGDPYTGAPLSGVTEDALVYDLMQEAYVRKLGVGVGCRDLGPGPQAGINKLCIDRVSVNH